MTNVRNFLHSTGNASAVTIYGQQVIPFLMNTGWLLALPIIMVIVDLWFGISESKQRGEAVRFSGAGWKTLRKLVDYYTILTLGFVIGQIIPASYEISVQDTCFYFILVPSLFDLCSILGHILKLRGVEISPRRLLVNLLVGFVKTKSCDMGQALENGLNEELNNSNNDERVSK